MAKQVKGDRQDDKVNASSQHGGRGEQGSSSFLNLPARERDVILQDRREKYPEEYGTMIEKYLKNLADNDR